MMDETLKKRAESASRGLSNLGMDDDADLIDELQAKVKKLEYLREGDERIRIKLQAKVEELEDVKERLSIDIMVLENQLKDALHLLFKSEGE